MDRYTVYSDTGCDIAPDVLEKLGIKQIPMSVIFDGDAGDFHGTLPEFYDRMRSGATPKTAAINPEAFCQCFRQELRQGRDVLYIAFSSGLSTTYNSACIAADILKEEYPERKVLAVDSLSASIGQGLMVYLAAKKMASGATLEELKDYVEETRLHICHWFTVDDLVYLKRGGRISPATAFVGNALGIKPILSVDNAGQLLSTDKIRGRKASIDYLIGKCKDHALFSENSPVLIAHGDCADDVEILKQHLAEKCGISPDLICEIGTTIGAHTGPGMLAVTFLGKER